MRREALHECIAALSGQLKAAIEQVYFEKQSLDDAALALESNRAAIGQRLSRARKGIHGCVTGKLKNEKSDE
jgi:DNA-directed RNA polymerase specialized sigma24 family protein